MEGVIQEGVIQIEENLKRIAESVDSEEVIRILQDNKKDELRILFLGDFDYFKKFISTILNEPEFIKIINSRDTLQQIFSISYATENYLEVVVEDKIQKYNLGQFIENKLDRQIKSSHAIRVYLNNPFMKGLNIQYKNMYNDLKNKDIEDKNHSLKWQEEIAKSDYVIFILNSLKLINSFEKEFIVSNLLPNIKVKNLLFIIDNIDTFKNNAEEGEYQELKDYLNLFFSNKMSKLDIMEYSSKYILKEENEETTAKIDEFNSFTNSLKANIKEVKEKSICNKKFIMNSILVDNLKKNKEKLKVEIQSKKRDIDILERINEGIPNRIQFYNHKVKVYINTFIKEDFLREIEGFSEEVINQINNDIDNSSNAEAIIDFLPKYLEMLWKDFFNKRIYVVQNKIISEYRKIILAIDEEISEKNISGDFKLNNKMHKIIFSPHKPNSILDINIKEEKKNIIPLSVQIGGLVLLPFNLPVAILTLGFGEYMKYKNKKDKEEKRKEEIKKLVKDNLVQYEKTIKKDVDTAFSFNSQSIEVYIKDIFKEVTLLINEKSKEIQGQLNDLNIKLEDSNSNIEFLSKLINSK